MLPLARIAQLLVLYFLVPFVIMLGYGTAYILVRLWDDRLREARIKRAMERLRDFFKAYDADVVDGQVVK
jgi:hypothetical protein